MLHSGPPGAGGLLSFKSWFLPLVFHRSNLQIPVFPVVLGPSAASPFCILFMIVTERERQAETQEEEGEAGSMHREPDVGFDPGSPGSSPGPKTGAKPLRHPGIPVLEFYSLAFYI